jgi:hypothetical protein
MTQPEGILVHAIRDTIQKNYPEAVILKMWGGPFMATGLPDLFVFEAGRAFVFEVKCRRVGESDEHARSRVTPTQALMMRRLAKAGAVTDCILSPSEALAVMQRELARDRLRKSVTGNA